MGNNGIRTYLAAIRSIYNDQMNSTAPFKGVMLKEEKTRSKSIPIPMMKLFYDTAISNIDKKPIYITGMDNCIDYFILSFLLGGLDIIDIAKLKPMHISDNRVIFKRNKGGTEEWINNIIDLVAKQIIDKYKVDKQQFLLPIHKIEVYDTFYRRFLVKIRKFSQKHGFQEYISSKSPRYSFINYSKNAGVPREVCSEIVGHAQQDVHSIYESGFPDEIKNKYHLQVIELVADYG